MADLGKVKRNAKRMAEQGASEAEIDEYVNAEGTSFAEISAFKGFASPEVEKEAAFRRKLGAGGMGMRVTDAATFGAAIPISAALEAGGKTVYKALTGEQIDPVGDYRFSRDVQDLILKKDRDEGGVAGYVGELALSVPFFGGKARAAVEAASQGPQLVKPAASYGSQLVDAVKQGALYSGIYGANSARGDLGDQLQHTAVSAGAGAALSPLLKMGIDAAGVASRIPGQVSRYITARTPEDIAAAKAAKAEFSESGVREFGPAITPSGTQRRTAEGLATSVFGAPLRREAQGAIDDATRAAQYAVREPIGNVPVTDAGAELQGVLNRNLTQRSIPSDRIERMTPEELARITGPIDDRGFSPIPPNVQPIAPRPVPPVRPEPVNPDAVPFEIVKPQTVNRPDVRPNYPRAEELPIPREAQDAIARMENAEVIARKQLNDAWNSFGEQARARGLEPNDIILGRVPITNIDDYPLVAAREAYKRMDAEHKQAVRALQEGQAAATEAQRQGWVKASQDAHARALAEAEAEQIRLQSAAAREADAATQGNRARAVRQAEDEARAKAEAETSLRRSEAEQEAATATERARQEAMRRFEEDRTTRPGFEIGRSPETYKTEFDAAYTQLNRETPKFGRNPMGERIAGLSKPTATETLMNQMALEQRAAGKLPGYRGVLYSEMDKAPRPGFLKNLRENIGDDVADRLEMLIGRRAKAQIGLSPDGMRDLITTVRREKQRATRPLDPMSSPNPEKAATLARLEGALREDYHQFIRETGPKGDRLVDMTRNVDAEYAKFVTGLRLPLSKLYGEKVQPIDALNKLAKAAEDGNLTMLRPYMRVMAEKADPLKGAIAIIAHKTNGAQDLQSFVSGYRSLHPDAMNVLFAGEKGQAARRSMDKLARVAERLVPFEKASKGGGIDLSNRANLTVGITAMANFFPAMVMSVGAAGAARFMASPRYAEWMTRTATARTPRQVEVSYGRLAAMLSHDQDLSGDMKERLKAVAEEVVAAKPAAAVFMGEGAKTARHDDLAKAKAAEAAGEPAEALWKKFGWLKDADGKWRSEIDDSKAALSEIGTALAAGGKRQTGKLTVGQILSHDDLFAAYPDLKSVPVRIGGTDETATWTPWNQTIKLGAKALKDPENLRLTLLHELQHAVQQKEQFAYGDFDAEWERRTGEAESYNVEQRANMSREQRRAALPAETMHPSMDPDVTSKEGLAPMRPWPSAKPGKKAPDGMMRLGGPREEDGGEAEQASAQYADLIAKAASAQGIEPGRVPPQSVIDAAWASSPTDQMAMAIEHIAKRHGLSLPWEK